MFKTISIPDFDWRNNFVKIIDFHDPVTQAQILKRYEHFDDSLQTLDAIEIKLDRLVHKFYPLSVDPSLILVDSKAKTQLMPGNMRFKNNVNALEEIKKIGNKQGTLDSWTARSGSPGSSHHHSTNNAWNDLISKLSSFVNENGVHISDILLHPQTLEEFNSNIRMSYGHNQNNFIPQSSEQHTNNNGIKFIADYNVPKNTLYCIDKEHALFKGQGPTIIHKSYDETHHMNLITCCEFVQYIAVNEQLRNIDRKFGMTLNVEP